MRKMKQESWGFGRNSHIPACRECRTRKAKCSKARPSCAQCTRANRECVYPSKVHRTPLTREHLTTVETRLQRLQTALQRLYPRGEIEAITRALLANDIPEDEMFTIEPNEQISMDGSFAPEPVALDAAFDAAQSLTQDNWDDFLTSMESHEQELPLTSSSAGSPTVGSVASELDERKFLDNYFLYYHTAYPFVHEATFRSDFKKSMELSHSWSILANMVLGIGSWLTPDGPDGLDQRYYAKAQHQLQQVPVSDKGSIVIIQALLLMSDFARKQGSPSECWHFIGTAVRMAITLNLHREPSNSELSELEKETRRRVWWAVYCSESCAAKIYGRPLLLPEEGLVTVKPVSNIHDKALVHSSVLFPTQTDDPTIYSGLIQQSSFHCMANTIYRRLLSTPSVTSHDVEELEQIINQWQINNSSFSTRLVKIDNIPDWHMTARRHQLLSDRGLRLLIYRPLLLQWLKKSHIDMNRAIPMEENQAEVHFRAQSLKIARNIIELVSASIVNERYSKLTLSFTLYAFFHALLVPVIHLKANPCSPESISYAQDIERAKFALKDLPTEGDALAQSFLVILRRLFSVASRIYNEDEAGTLSSDHTRATRPDELRESSNNIFGNEELKLLETEALKCSSGPDFSEWLHT